MVPADPRVPADADSQRYRSPLDAPGVDCYLLVDDHNLGRLIEACLQRHGLRVTRTDTLAELMRVIDQRVGCCPVAVIDIVSLPSPPDCTGIADVSAVPTLLLANEQQYARLLANRMPGQRLICKPFSPPEFVLSVRLMLLEHYGLTVVQTEPVGSSRFVLDLFSGSGYSTFIASGNLSPESVVVGSDISERAALGARTAARGLGITNVFFVVADAVALPFATGAFDQVLQSGSGSPLPYFAGDANQLREEIIRVTKRE